MKERSKNLAEEGQAHLEYLALIGLIVLVLVVLWTIVQEVITRHPEWLNALRSAFGG